MGFILHLGAWAGSAHSVSYLVPRASAHPLKCTHSGAGSEARQQDMLPKAEEVEVGKGSTISGKLDAVRRGTVISRDDGIAVLEERRVETKEKTWVF